MLAQLVVALAALAAIVLGWNSMRSSSESINALNTLGVQQADLLKDAYALMLRGTIRADIVVGLRNAGDTAGVAENTRTLKQQLAEARTKMEAFKAIPKVTEQGKAAESELLSSFQRFADALQAMVVALERGDMEAYLKEKNTTGAAASQAFSQRLAAFMENINAYSVAAVEAALRDDPAPEFAADLASLEPDEVPLNFLNPRPGTPFENIEPMESNDALRTIAAFRLALPRTILRFAGGREITLGDLGAKQGILGGINAVIVGNYLTTLGRDPKEDLALLEELEMPIKALNETL